MDEPSESADMEQQGVDRAAAARERLQNAWARSERAAEEAVGAKTVEGAEIHTTEAEIHEGAAELQEEAARIQMEHAEAHSGEEPDTRRKPEVQEWG